LQGGKVEKDEGLTVKNRGMRKEVGVVEEELARRLHGLERTLAWQRRGLSGGRGCWEAERETWRGERGGVVEEAGGVGGSSGWWKRRLKGNIVVNRGWREGRECDVKYFS